VAEAYPPVEPVILHAMSWAKELGVPSVRPGTGAALRLLAGAARARGIVEIGTGTGVSGLWLLRGMREDGVLTSIDIEPEHQAMAKQSFAAAGFAAGRARLIAGTARQVLPRLADDSYDLVFVDGDIADYPHSVREAHRLLRQGGVLVVNNALGVDLSPDEAAVVRELVAYVREAPEWAPVLINTGTGLLCANRL
jgi:predicted O-methyltransferase YrrM